MLWRMGHRTYFHLVHLESIKSNGKKSLPKVNEANDSGVGLRPPVPGAIGLQFTNGVMWGWLYRATSSQDIF